MMTQPNPPEKTLLRGRLIAVAVWVFLVIWVTGMLAGLAAGTCRKPDKAPVKVERFCTISITAGSVFPGQARKRARLYLNRGIARAKLGKLDKALADMARAIRDVQLRIADGPEGIRRDPYKFAIVSRVADEPEGSPARVLFEEALAR